jgi:hypothetical protein
MLNARTKVAVLLGTLGISLLGAVAVPAVASADPFQPYWTGPQHPVRHYGGDLEHPAWSVTHPIRAVVP